MARHTSVYGEFVLRLDEVALLRKKARILERSQKSLFHGPEIRALCRGSVVLLSSHIEAYIKELGEHALDKLYVNGTCRSAFPPQFFYHISKEKIDCIRSTSQPEKIAEHVLDFISHDVSYWGNCGGLPAPIPSQEFNAGFSNPTFEKVKAYFGRFGYTDFRRDFMKALGREANGNIANLDQIVMTRNAIAHGESSATKTPTEIKDMEISAKLFCRSVDGLFAEWCKKRLCPIR